jgi:hypothetical protein
VPSNSTTSNCDRRNHFTCLHLLQSLQRSNLDPIRSKPPIPTHIIHLTSRESRVLSHPPIQALQVPLEIIPLPLLLERLLRPRILIAGTIIVIRDGDLLARLLLPRARTGLHAHHLAEAVYLVENHALHIGDLVDDFELEVKCCGARGLVGRIVPDLQVAVLQRLFDADTAAGVEGEKAIEQVQGVWVGVAEERLEGDLLHAGEVADVVLGAGRANARKGLFVGGSEVVQDLVQLVDVVTALEEGLAAEQLGQDTAY